MYTAILLAAGRSSRMGQLKGLLDWKGKPLIKYQLEQLFSSLLDQIILVLGYQAEEYLSVIQKDTTSLMVVCNEKWEEGKSSSIRKGLHTMNRDCKAILFVNLDQPVTNKIVNQLIYSFETNSQKIHIPSCQGRRGHPVLFSSQLLGELKQVNEQTQGLRNIIRIHSNEIQLVETGDPKILYNFNSPLDYKGGSSNEII
jgi:molybdenum cofactor cytidylyltransferase